MSGSSDLLMQSMQSNIDSGAYQGPNAGQALATGLTNAGAILQGQAAPASPVYKAPAGQASPSQDQHPLAAMQASQATLQAPPVPPPPAPPPDAPSSGGGMTPQLSGMMGGMAASGGDAMSDKNLKKNIKKTIAKDIESFVQSLTPKSYDYKDKQDGTHTEGGLMAQDLQKSKIGASTVVKTPRGLAVDTVKLTPILAAVMSHKVKELEAKIDSALSTKFKKGKK